MIGLHRLTAGAGYQYLLKHTVSGDCDRTGAGPRPIGTPGGPWPHARRGGAHVLAANLSFA